MPRQDLNIGTQVEYKEIPISKTKDPNREMTWEDVVRFIESFNSSNTSK